MRLDHIAYRVADRHKTANFFCEALGYRIQTEFDLKFKDGTTTECIALEPPEKPDIPDDIVSPGNIWSTYADLYDQAGEELRIAPDVEYHLAPEIFVSDGEPDSIVGKWVAERGGIGGIHHIAYQVDSVEKTMKEWREKGWADFASEDPLTCPDDELVQIFTVPHQLTGVIYEFIERGENGFCQANVQNLMESTKDFK
ncbi:MAG: VOC family protein [Candidatus Thorarchaeota archaeon]|jgi:catechol 2,3-dioxygenase-like lactoylglutathione lyase family enzyme